MKISNTLKQTCLMACLILCFVFSACSLSEQNQTTNDSATQKTDNLIEHAAPERITFNVENTEESNTEYSYVYDNIYLTNNYRIDSIIPTNNSLIYIIAISCDEEGYFVTDENGEICYQLLAYDLEKQAETGFTYIPDYSGYDSYGIVCGAVSTNDDSLWCLIAFNQYNGDTTIEKYNLINIAPDGTVIKEVDLPLSALHSNVDMLVDKEGHIYLLGLDFGIKIYDSFGKVLFDKSLESMNLQMCLDADDNVWLLSQSDSSYELNRIDRNNWTICEPIQLSGVSNGMPYLCNGYFPSGIVYLTDATGLYCVNLETGLATKTEELDKYGVTSPGRMLSMQDGSFIYLSSYKFISQLRRIASTESTTKTVLTLATVYPESPVIELVDDFNRNNENYYVKVFDFSEYMNSGSYSELYEVWNTAFADGDMPDMIDFFNLPWHTYAEKGYLLDLNEYIETTEILPWVWNSIKYNEANYTFPGCFVVETLIGKKSSLKEHTSWTAEEFFEISDTLPDDIELFDGISRELFVFYLEQYMLDDFVNYEEGSCDFTNETFIDWLEFANSLKPYLNDETEDYQSISTTIKVRRDSVLLAPTIISSITQMHNLKNYTIGEDISWIGWPCKNGTKIQTMSDIAIMANSENITGSIAFLEYLMTEECQNTLATDFFPITNRVFRNELEKAQTNYSGMNTEIATEKIVDGVVYQITPVSVEEATEFTDWLATINGKTYYQWDIASIIDEECKAMYSGDKTAEQIAEIIQNRVSIYLSEQR